ncbi:DUF1365 domain-containing protein [Brevundimonas sp. SORGH_AS_0993]|uniref:DUF1365 domain-containing protein n=1 Tax=Brevundimonas sp. SORGH_AS_0993 TaxID=3041794 RepID=UPI002782E798|nr:DUF1365 family protein [Brevundimonas sp. SORGH_AS_0993]MDQ1154485.1 DUF1365 family protein [Brevundimonas sp. SORGH_AS_0993]
MISALYRGEVMHRRLRPREHRLRYRVFWLLLDLGELEAIDRRLRLFSRNRFNLLGFHDRDHGDGSEIPLRDQILAHLDCAGVDIGDGAIRLLTMPRILGYVFNPISLYYCHAPDGRLAAVIYEVTSTFGQRHAYVLPVADEDARGGRFRQGAAKALHVSPFMGMDMRYAFRGHAPSERLDLAIDGFDSEGLLIVAAMKGRRRPLTDAALLEAALSMPALTLKVVGAIHWEALKLWLKRTPLHPAPPSSTLGDRERRV